MRGESTRSPARAWLPMGIGWSVAATWFIIDQGVKWWILERVMAPPRVIAVTDFFNLVLGWNTGISFGMLSGAALPPWTLALFAIAVSGILLFWMFQTHNWFVSVALGLLIGGALSNALDRLHRGAVVDFLDFHVAGWHWPAFNLADAGIVCGVIVLMLDALIMGRADTSTSENTS